MAKKKNSAVQAIIVAVQGFIRLLTYVLIIMLVIYAGRVAYEFGYMVFETDPVSQSHEDVLNVTIEVEEGDGIYQIGEKLANKGLVEYPLVFWLQEKVIEYEGTIQPGTYQLSTDQSMEEIIAVLTNASEETGK